MKEIQFFKFGLLKTIIVVIGIFILRFVSQTFMPIGGSPSFLQLNVMSIAKIAYLLLIVYLIITIAYSLFLKFKK